MTDDVDRLPCDDVVCGLGGHLSCTTAKVAAETGVTADELTDMADQVRRSREAQ